MAVGGITVFMMPDHACIYKSFASSKVEDGAGELTVH
jgi:hypothetical protein